MTGRKLFNMVATLVFCAASPLAFAQDQKMVADIPFEFHFAGKVMQAGHYEVSKIGQSAILLQNSDTRNGVAATAMTAEKLNPGEARLVFNRYGGDYFLHEIWSVGTSGKELPQSKLEKELRAAAQRNAGTTIVALK